jgi:hypothetical protein
MHESMLACRSGIVAADRGDGGVGDFALVVVPPRPGVCSDGSAVTFSIARISRSAAGLSPR